MVKKIFFFDSSLALVILALAFSWCSFSKSLKPTNPLITHFEWGKVTVSFKGTQKIFKDCKLFPQNAQEWDWKEFGTQHVPGIQVKDLQNIIYDSDIIILSRGVELVLQVPDDTVEYAKKLGKEVYVLQSEEAVKRYNELATQQKKVGILLHSTC